MVVVETQHAASLRRIYSQRLAPTDNWSHTENRMHYTCRMFSDLRNRGVGRRRRIRGSGCRGHGRR